MVEAVELVSSTDDIVKVIATAARICYSGLPLEKLTSKFTYEDNQKLIRKVASMGHLSVVEHAVFTFKVPLAFKEEIFEILINKPFLKVSTLEDGFLISLNLRTLVELKSELAHLKIVKEFSRFIPDFLSSIDIN